MAARLGSREQGERSTLQGGWPTLAEVIANLDGEVRVVHAPGGVQAPVSDAAIFDAADSHSVHAGAIVLGVGLSSANGDAVTLVDAAGREGAVAVVFRSGDEFPPRLVEIAEELGVALLTVPPEMTWGQLYSLLRTAILSAGAPDKAEPAGIPVGDLFAVADAVAAAVGGPVTIEDPQMRVLAYSNLEQPIDEARRQTILDRTPPLLWQRRLDEAGVTQALRRGEGVVRFAGFEHEGLAPRLAAAVRAGSEVLGAIWVAEGEAPLGEAAERELLRAADVAAVHLLAHRASEDLKRRTRGALVRELLEGCAPPPSAAAAGLRPDVPVTALVFAPAAGDRLLPLANPERVLSVISLYCEDAHRDAMCALLDERFWAVLPTPAGNGRASTVKLASKIVGRVRCALHVRLLAAIGESVDDVGDVPRSRRSAERALAILARRGGAGAVVHIDDVRAHAALLELLDVAMECSAIGPGKLATVLEHDREHGSRYAATLRAYLDCSRDVTCAAKRMRVHPNTLRYRLRRIVALSGLALDDPDERLLTELQLRLPRL